MPIETPTIDDLLDQWTVTVQDATGQPRVLFRPAPGQIPILIAGTRDPVPSTMQHLSQARHVFVRSQRGTGKSFVGRWRMFILAMRYPGFKFLIYRKRYTDLAKGHLLTLQTEADALGLDWNRSTNTLRFPNGSIGIFFAADSEDDTSKILGAEFTSILYDESPEADWSDLMAMNASLRAPVSMPFVPSALYLGNPRGASIQEHDEFFVEKSIDPEDEPQYRPDEWQVVVLTRADNPHIDEQQYLGTLIGLDRSKRAAWVHGERVDDDALFQISRSRAGAPWHVIESLPTLPDGSTILDQPWVLRLRGFDWGFSPDPAAALDAVVVGRHILITREQIWRRTIIQDIAAQLLRQQQIPGTDPPSYWPVQTYIDPSMEFTGRGMSSEVRSLADALRQCGISARPAHNNRTLVADVIQLALHEEVEGKPRLQIHASCTRLLNALPKMKSDLHHPGRLAPHRDDHLVVCLGFILMMHASAVQTEPAPTPRHLPWGLTHPTGRVLGSSHIRKR